LEIYVLQEVFVQVDHIQVLHVLLAFIALLEVLFPILLVSFVLVDQFALVLGLLLLIIHVHKVTFAFLALHLQHQQLAYAQKGLGVAQTLQSQRNVYLGDIKMKLVHMLLIV
jgi:hypothetical protein